MAPVISPIMRSISSEFDDEVSVSSVSMFLERWIQEGIQSGIYGGGVVDETEQFAERWWNSLSS